MRPIVIYGEHVLHIEANPVTHFDDALRQLVDDMFETMDAAPGVGLAAPQVGVSLRVFVFDYPTDNGTPRRGVAINPELLISPIDVREPDATDEEGCLSFPGERYPLLRAERALLKAVDINGEPFEFECDGWFARIMQHEFDHLNGILYVDRLDDPFDRDAEKVLKRNGWGKPGSSWMPGVDNLDA